MTARPVPDGYRWGVTTAGHQHEGDNTASATWLREGVQSTIVAERSGTACHTWQMWEQDPDLTRGIRAYRAVPGDPPAHQR